MIKKASLISFSLLTTLLLSACGGPSGAPEKASGGCDDAQGNITDIVSDIAERQTADSDAEATGEELDAIKKQLEGWFNCSVKPKAGAAESNEDVLKDAVSEYTNWLAQVQAQGFEDEFADKDEEAKKSLGKGLDNAIKKAAEKCVKNSDLSQIPKMTEWLGYAQGLGLEDYMTTTEEKIEEHINQCAQFELTLNSTFTVDGESDVKSGGNTPISFDADLNTFSGTGRHQQEFYNFESFSCKPGGNGNTLGVVQMSLDFEKEQPDISVVIRVSEGQQGPVNYNCSGAGRTIPLQLPDPWISSFHVAHEGDYVGGQTINGIESHGQDYLIEGWQMGTGANFASKQYSGSIGSGIVENTTIKISHTPGS